MYNIKKKLSVYVCIFGILLSATGSLAADTGEYIHYRLALQFKNEKKYDQAIEEFRKVLAVYPDHYQTYMHLAQIRQAQGNYQLTIFNLQRALLYNPGWGRAQLMLAEAFAADGQLDRAIREYQTYQAGSDPIIRDSIQTVISGLMNRMRGIDETQPAVAPHAASTQAQTQRAQAAPTVRLDPRAEEIMKKVISLYGQGNDEETLAAVREILAIQRDHPGAFYYAGLIRMKNGQNDMAKINFRRAIPHPVYGGAANFYLGKILGEEGARNDAVRHLRAALATNATDFDRSEAARLIELYGGQRPVAGTGTIPPAPVAQRGVTPVDSASLRTISPEKYTSIEIRIDTMLSMMTVDTVTDVGQKLLAGIRAFQEGRFDDALREFKLVLAENPGGPIVAHCIYNIAICYYRLRLFKDAETQFQLFLNRFPNHRFAPRAQFFKASCYQERGDYATSERLFRQFIRDNRSHEWVGRAYERLGDSFVDLEQYKRAMDAYTPALAASNVTPADRVILNFKLGNAAAAIGDNNRAINFYRAAIDTGEKNNIHVRVPDSYYKTADIRFRQRNFQAALDLYQQVTRKYPTFQETPWGLFQIAGAHRNLKQYREAVDTYRDLMQKFPDDYWARQAQWRLEDTIWEHENRSAQK